MGRPREHDSETANALLAVAERILEAEGLEAVTLRRVADEANTTTRAVYSLFGSKEGLLAALGAHAFEMLHDIVASQRQTRDAAADLARAGLGFRAFAVGHPALFRLAVRRESADPALVRRFAAAADRTFSVLEARVKRAKDAGLLGNRDVYQAAVEYHALCEGLASVELRGALRPRRGYERTWKDALDALVTGFASSH